MFMDDPFADDDDDLKVGFSQYNTSPCRTHSKTYKRDTYRAMPVAAKFFVEETTDEKPHHFLDSCALCMMPLRLNRNIYMYRGNVPFCSEECRQEQIEMDEVMEKSRKLSKKETSATIKAQKNSNVASPPKHQSLHVRAGAVVVG